MLVCRNRDVRPHISEKGEENTMRDVPSILFVAITPPEYVPSNVRNYGIKRRFQLIPHKHSVLALTAWLRERGCDGHYVWINEAGKNPLFKVEKAIWEKNPDAIGFSLATEELLSHYKVIEKIKKLYPEIPIIVGGHHVSAEPIHTLLNFPLIDYVCIGEGECTLEEWLKNIVSGNNGSDMREVKGLGFRDLSGDVVINPPRDKIQDINILPDPAFDLIVDPECMDNSMTAFPLIGSYGCRYYCTFCAADHGNYRYMSSERMVDQIQNAQQKYGVEYFAIRDSFWPPSDAWLDEFCTLVENRKLRIKFHFETRAGTLNCNQYKRLKRIGLQAVAVGVESGDPWMLRSMKKAITIDLARRTFHDLHKAGICSVAFFMLGNYGETMETIHRSEKVAHELNPTLISLATFRPLPGTESFEFVKPEDRDWWMRGKYPSICSLPIRELDKAREEVHIRYPLRWDYLKQHVFAGRLGEEYRSLAWNSFLVHLRKYMLGVSERSGLMRFVIHVAKHMLRNAHTVELNGS